MVWKKPHSGLSGDVLLVGKRFVNGFFLGVAGKIGYLDLTAGRSISESQRRLLERICSLRLVVGAHFFLKMALRFLHSRRVGQVLAFD